jgi:hypothetical protein
MLAMLVKNQEKTEDCPMIASPHEEQQQPD